MSISKAPRGRFARFMKMAAIAMGLALASTTLVATQANAETPPVVFQTFGCKGSQIIWEGGTGANSKQQQTYSPKGLVCIVGGNYKASFQSDGNLVVRYKSKAIWQSATGGKLGKSGFLKYQTDGNLVAYYSNNGKTTGSTIKAKWSTKSNGKTGPGRVLRMQKDGNLVLYSCKHPHASTTAGLGIGKALWSTHTAGKK